MYEKLFFLEIQGILKRGTEIETVFTKVEMNKEWNVNFLGNTRSVKKYRDWSRIYKERNMRCVKQISRLKLYLPK